VRRACSSAKGPGHQRDTELVLLESGFSEELRQLKVPFVDLNRDELVMTPLLATYTGMKQSLVAPDGVRGRLRRLHA